MTDSSRRKANHRARFLESDRITTLDRPQHSALCRIVEESWNAAAAESGLSQTL
jgi:hypothetical protein